MVLLLLLLLLLVMGGACAMGLLMSLTRSIRVGFVVFLIVIFAFVEIEIDVLIREVTSGSVVDWEVGVNHGLEFILVLRAEHECINGLQQLQQE